MLEVALAVAVCATAVLGEFQCRPEMQQALHPLLLGSSSSSPALLQQRQIAAATTTAAPHGLPLDEPNGPACLDGTPYKFYFQASATGSSKWTISLAPGGWCYDEVDCLCRANTSLGTSTMNPPNMTLPCWNPNEDGTMDNDCNRIHMPYCDGASYSGFRPGNVSVPGMPGKSIHMRGIKNIDGVIQFALKHGMNKATELVITGGSAGGMATFLHADRFAAALPAGAKAWAAPVVGYFLDHSTYKRTSKGPYGGKPNTPGWSQPGGPNAANFTMWMKYVVKMQNITFSPDGRTGGGLTKACQAKHPSKPWLCFMSPHMQDVITTPFFMCVHFNPRSIVLILSFMPQLISLASWRCCAWLRRRCWCRFNSKYDEWQIENVLQTKWITKAEQAGVLQYGLDFLAALASVYTLPETKNGGVITSCMCHACPWPALKLEGKTAYEHFADWFYGKTTGVASMHINPSLPNGNGSLQGGAYTLCAAYPQSQPPPPPVPPSPAPGGGQIRHGCNLIGGFYESAPLALAECIAQCQAEGRCQGTTWKHTDASGGLKTPNCTGLAGQPCCYFQSKVQISGRGRNPNFDCFDKASLPPIPQPPVPPPPPLPPSPPPPSFSGDGVPPFYADPVFDAAHDPELVWHEGESCWWMIYLQNRYNSPYYDPAGSCPYCVYTDIGLASTPDAGKTWIYRGVAEGLDLPVALRNASDPSTRPPAAQSQQYGGATWWRPAVVRHGGLYHGFWVYNPDPGLAMRSSGLKIVHYTSRDLKQWEFAEVARNNPVAYDSVVFRAGPRKGRSAGNTWLLFSTRQGRNVSGSVAKPLQSANLYNWTECEDPAELIDIGEGPHVTGSKLNDATSTWNSYAWLNYEGGFVARSQNSGATWEMQNGTSPATSPPAGKLFVPASVAPHTHSFGGITDWGIAHQGPLIPQGDRMFVLYFSEFNTSPPEPERSEVNSKRSVLHLREVVATKKASQDGGDGTTWLTCNRSDTAFLQTLQLEPPEDASAAAAATTGVGGAAMATEAVAAATAVWYVALEEASVIALAELNRWHPGWYPHGNHTAATGCAQAVPLPHDCETAVYKEFRLAAGYYRELHSPTAEACVATCKAEPVSANCGAVVFKENQTAGGLGVECGAGFTCCYLITAAAAGAEPVGNCHLPCSGWDSWAFVGIKRGGGQPADPTRVPGYPPNFGKWRDPKIASRFVKHASKRGSGAATQWQLAIQTRHALTHQELKYEFDIAGNGTILEMRNVSIGSKGEPVTPLRQWRRIPPFHYGPI